MDEQGNFQSHNGQPPIEDLTVNADDAVEVKGGAVIYRNINGTWTQLSADVAL